MEQLNDLDAPTRRPGHHARKFVVSLLVAGGLGWALHKGALPVLPSSGSLANASFGGVASFAVLFVVSSLIRAAKWWWLLAPIQQIPLRRVVSVSLIGYAALFVLPFRMGEFVRPLMIRKAGLSGWAAMGSVAAERVIDGLAVTLLLTVGLTFSEPLSPLPDHIGGLAVSAAVIPRLCYSAIVLFSIAFAVLALFYFKRQLAQRTVEVTLGRLSRGLADWLIARIGQLADGLQFVRRPRYGAPFVALTLLYWLTFGAANWALLSGCGIHEVSAAEVCVLIGVFSLAILLPGAPGFFGTFQMSLYAALSLYVHAETVTGAGSAFVFINYVGQIGLTLLLGGIALVLERAEASRAK